MSSVKKPRGSDMDGSNPYENLVTCFTYQVKSPNVANLLVIIKKKVTHIRQDQQYAYH
jgi:hypothetical protein